MVEVTSNHRINAGWQFRCAPLPAGYAARCPEVRRVAWARDLARSMTYEGVIPVNATIGFPLGATG
jgi:hypothetical protein